MDFKLGDVLKDRVTGFQGVAVSRIEYLNGCIQYELKSQKLTKEGDTMKTHWIDSQQITRVGAGVNVKKRVTGGPAPRSLPSAHRS